MPQRRMRKFLCAGASQFHYVAILPGYSFWKENAIFNSGKVFSFRAKANEPSKPGVGSLVLGNSGKLMYSKMNLQNVHV